jgi:RNA polymerase-binding transcription factor
LKTSTHITRRDRLLGAKRILESERTEACKRIRDLRHEQDQDAIASPTDELDDARSLAEAETRAGLIEHAEYRVKAIDAALSRFDRNCYGICEECGEQIPVKRLEALPFAPYCIECEQKRNNSVRPGEGAIDEASSRLWTPPPEMDETLETQDSLTEPEENLVVHDKEPFGPEIGEFEQLPPVATSRRRGRIKQTRGE